MIDLVPFVPESAGDNRAGNLWTNDSTNCTWVYEVPIQVLLAKKTAETLQYKSGEKNAREYDCVLVFDEGKKCYYLERIHSSFTFNLNRGAPLKQHASASSTPLQRSPPVINESKLKKTKLNGRGRKSMKRPDATDEGASSDDEFNISEIVKETIGSGTLNSSGSEPSVAREAVQEFVEI